MCPTSEVVKLLLARPYRPLPPWQAIGARPYVQPLIVRPGRVDSDRVFLTGPIHAFRRRGLPPGWAAAAAPRVRRQGGGSCSTRSPTGWRQLLHAFADGVGSCSTRWPTGGAAAPRVRDRAAAAAPRVRRQGGRQLLHAFAAEVRRRGERRQLLAPAPGSARPSCSLSPDAGGKGPGRQLDRRARRGRAMVRLGAELASYGKGNLIFVVVSPALAPSNPAAAEPHS